MPPLPLPDGAQKPFAIENPFCGRRLALCDQQPIDRVRGKKRAHIPGPEADGLWDVREADGFTFDTGVMAQCAFKGSDPILFPFSIPRYGVQKSSKNDVDSQSCCRSRRT